MGVLEDSLARFDRRQAEQREKAKAEAAERRRWEETAATEGRKLTLEFVAKAEELRIPFTAQVHRQVKEIKAHGAKGTWGTYLKDARVTNRERIPVWNLSIPRDLSKKNGVTLFSYSDYLISQEGFRITQETKTVHKQRVYRESIYINTLTRVNSIPSTADKVYTTQGDGWDHAGRGVYLLEAMTLFLRGEIAQD